jgi:hypothetical protein
MLHAKTETTLKHYTDRELLGIANAIEKLPPMVAVARKVAPVEDSNGENGMPAENRSARSHR